jgi:hydroxymethylpyrimidine pyrophosphatase-like HAD family hydrolase
MRVRVLALDYDGTVAEDGRLDPGVHSVLVHAASRSVTTLLVTGRILADLERLLVDRLLFDAIVAENGAVLCFPGSGRTLLLAQPPPEAFIAELRHREIPFLAGECVVEADAAHASAMLSVIRDMELPLVLSFNRGRMMVLPQAVSKATGLREAVRALRLSVHDAVGIGDAENDHQLLLTCELGVAVEWGSAALRAVADEVLPGSGPGDVAPFLDALLREPRIDPLRLAHRTVHLGVAEGGAPFAIAMRGRNLLIAGDTQSGKSWLAGVFCEQLILDRYSICVIDPEGEYDGLESLPSVIVLQVDDPVVSLDDLERTLRYPDVSVVLDLSAIDLDLKRRIVHSVLDRLCDLRRRTGLPHRIIVDEAHYFLQEPDVASRLETDQGGYTFVTWQVADMAPSVVDSFDEVLATRVSSNADMRLLHEQRGGTTTWAEWSEALGSVGPTWALRLPAKGDASGRPVSFRVSPRLTFHVRHHKKYLQVNAPRGKEFVFRGGDAEGVVAHSLSEVVAVLEDLHPSLDEHVRRHDLSRWIREVFADGMLGNRVQVLEEQAASGRIPDVAKAIADVVRARYCGSAEGASDP